MKSVFSLFLLTFVFLFNHTFGQNKLIITTDIGQDPDDTQSFIRLLHYANEFEIMGIIANADANYEHEKPEINTEILYELIEAYSKIENNLRKYDLRYPQAESLKKKVKIGCAGNGTKVPVEKYIGTGKDTEGSDWIIKVVDEESNKVHISVWGGACDLAQALWKVKNQRTATEQNKFIEKLRVYFIGKQDTSNDWVLKNFPDLWVILSYNENDSYESAYRGMFYGGNMEYTSLEWVEKTLLNINALANKYPTKTHTGGKNKNPYGAMKEGDSPSFLYFLENGLNIPEKPEAGGWGGRFIRKDRNVFVDVSGTYRYDEQNARESVYRWRVDFQNDFAMRVKWGSSDGLGNQKPIVRIKGFDENMAIIEVKNKKTLNANPSFDPDGDKLLFEWIPYPFNNALKQKTQNGNKLKVRKIMHSSKWILKVSDPWGVCAYKRINII